MLNCLTLNSVFVLVSCSIDSVKLILWPPYLIILSKKSSYLISIECYIWDKWYFFFIKILKYHAICNGVVVSHWNSFGFLSDDSFLGLFPSFCNQTWKFFCIFTTVSQFLFYSSAKSWLSKLIKSWHLL